MGMSVFTLNLSIHIQMKYFTVTSHTNKNIGPTGFRRFGYIKLLYWVFFRTLLNS